MTNRQAAMTYGVLVASAVALALLIADFPTARNLFIAVGAGLAVGIGSWIYQERH